jgi:hypothetical protein
MVAGSTRSSARSSSPSRLVVAASNIGATRIGSASWFLCDRTTTSRLDSGSTSTCTPFNDLGGYLSFHTWSCSFWHLGYGGGASNPSCSRFHGNGFRDCGPFDLCFCQHKAHIVRTHVYKYYAGQLTLAQSMYLLPWCYGFSLRQRCGFLNFRLPAIFTSFRTGFFTIPG